MRNLWLLIFLLVAVDIYFLVWRAGEVMPPENVYKAFQVRYPNTPKTIWKIHDGNYRASWGGKSGNDTVAAFSSKAEFIEEDVAIPTDELPDLIKSYLKKHFDKADISKASCKTDSKGKKMCTAEINGENLVFDDNGNFLKVEN